MIDPRAGSGMRPLEAFQALSRFASRKGEAALRLAMHAAVPQTLRPDMVHLIKLNFVPEAASDFVVEADVLLAPFTEDLGGGYLRFDSEARRLLIENLAVVYAHERTLRVRRVAEFLLTYAERMEKHSRTRTDRVLREFIEVQRWVALGFLWPDRAANQLAEALKKSESPVIAARLNVAGIADALTIPLAHRRDLLEYAAGLHALRMGDRKSATALLEPLGSLPMTAGGVTLKSAAELLDEVRQKTEVPRVIAPNLPTSSDGSSIEVDHLDPQEHELQAVQEAVERNRGRVKAEGEAFLPDLAESLSNLSAVLGNLGQHEEWLKTMQEAAGIYRKLAEANPDAYLPRLTESLNNSSVRLGELGRREEGLQAVQEAVEIQRKLAQARLDVLLPDLATSLKNLSVCLSELGRRDEALQAVQEAVEIRRKLAAASPDAFLPALAESLNNLSIRLGELARPAEGLQAVEEAVEIRRKLATASPDAFLPAMASSLNNLSLRLDELGRRDEGLRAVGEAVEIYRKLAAAHPDAFLPDLAMSLNNLSVRLGEFGQRKEGLRAAQQAVDIYRKLAATRPGAFGPALVSSLNNLSVRLRKLGRHNQASAVSREAVAVAPRRVGIWPHLPHLGCEVLLCHAYLDAPFVERIALRLMREGVTPWLDTWNLVPGQSWIEEVLGKCAAIAVFIGSHGLAPWHVAGMGVVIQRQSEDRHVRVIPVLLPGAAPDDVPPFFRSFAWVKFETEDDEEALRRLVSGIRGVPPNSAPASEDLVP